MAPVGADAEADPKVADKDQLGQFEASAGEWYRWQSVARDFIRAANYLLDWYDLPRREGDPEDLSWTHQGPAPMMVLYAVAAENLLKAVLVAQGSPPVVNGKLAGAFKHHRLTQHAENAGLKLSADERNLLERLGDLVEAGRYPVATAPGKNPGAWRFDYPGDVQRTFAMLQRLEDALYSTGKTCLPRVDLKQRFRSPGYSVTEAG